MKRHDAHLARSSAPSLRQRQDPAPFKLAPPSTLVLALVAWIGATSHAFAQEKPPPAGAGGPVRSFPASIAKERAKEPPRPGPAEQAKIVGGKDAQKGQFKWQVGLIRADAPIEDPFSGFFCGASLIGWRWVLTAAHCTYEGHWLRPIEARAESINVYLGSHDFSAGQRIAVKRIVRHPSYNARTQDSDLALLELEAEPQDKSQLELLRLVAVGDETRQQAGRTATVLGWGSTGRGVISQHLRRSVQVLQYVDDIRFKSSDQCNQYHVNDRRAQDAGFLKAEGKSDGEIRATLDARYPPGAWLISDDMICAGTSDGSKDACFGDSGGPLLVYRRGDLVQAGIVSWGPSDGCGLTNLFGVYVRLSRYLDWVAANMN